MNVYGLEQLNTYNSAVVLKSIKVIQILILVIIFCRQIQPLSNRHVYFRLYFPVFIYFVILP